jgi:hypothetical protein
VSDDQYLTLDEELDLGAPIALDDGEIAICDVRGCERRASSIVPGAMLCSEHEREFGIGLANTYMIPVAELFDAGFIEVRRGEYEERLREARERHLIRRP